jgi:hypothetical protein
MLNKIWSILARGEFLTPYPYNRKVTQEAYLRNNDVDGLISILVPYGDKLYRTFHIEECVQLLLMSELRERALEFDPINTYEKSNMVYPTAGEFVDELGSGRVQFFTDEGALRALGTGDVQIECEVDSGAMTLTTLDGVFDYTLTNNQSSEIELRTGLKIRLYGPLPGGTFSFTVSYIDDTFVEWGTILQNIENLKTIPWQDGDLKEVWDKDIYWVNRMAAIILNAVEFSERP